MSKFPVSAALLSVRTALILLLGGVSGATTSALTYLTDDSWAAALLAGFSASVVEIAFFHRTIALDQHPLNGPVFPKLRRSAK